MQKISFLIFSVCVCSKTQLHKKGWIKHNTFSVLYFQYFFNPNHFIWSEIFYLYKTNTRTERVKPNICVTKTYIHTDSVKSDAKTTSRLQKQHFRTPQGRLLEHRSSIAKQHTERCHAKTTPMAFPILTMYANTWCMMVKLNY